MLNKNVPIPGIDTLLNRHIDWLKGARVGLIAHPASVNAQGISTAQLMHDHDAINLAALLGPEHGYTGTALAGEKVTSNYKHPWNIPVYSLYGDTRKPTEEMLKNIDVLVFDLQDIPIRCYTYSSTLRYVMQAAAEYNCRLIIADRPTPLFRIIDGPMLNPDFESFVGMINTPFCYGMTSGETAQMIQTEELPALELQVAPLMHRGTIVHPTTTPTASWIPPSPALSQPMNAFVYPITVFCEALPSLEYGKNTKQAFRILAAKWMNGEETADAINQNMNLPGLTAIPIQHQPATGPHKGQRLSGIELSVENPQKLNPACSAYKILLYLQKKYGKSLLWNAEGTRPGFFDKLAGTNTFRENLQAGIPFEHVYPSWGKDASTFSRRTKPYLIY